MAENMTDCSLGIDIGTSSIKVAVIEKGSLRILSSKTLNHIEASNVVRDDLRLNEQKPMLIIGKVEECLRSITPAILGRVSSVTVCGQMHGLLLWSKTGEEGRDTGTMDLASKMDEIDFHTNLITWQDKRCDKKFLDTLPNSKIPISTGFGCATLFWLQRYQKEVVQVSECAGSIMDLLVYLVCNLETVLTSDQIAHSWGYYDPELLCWEYAVLDCAGFPTRLLPFIKSRPGKAGTLQSNWCGIPKGCSINAAFGDLQCAIFASVSDLSSAVMNIGTSAQLAIIVQKPFIQNLSQRMFPAIQFFPYFEGHYLAIAASLNGGNVFDSFVKMLNSWLFDLGIEALDCQNVHNRIRELCNGIQNDDDDDDDGDDDDHDHSLSIQPMLLGERHNPTQKANVVNIDNTNIHLKEILRHICNGIVRNLFEMMPATFLQTSSIGQIVCTGSVLTNNEYLRKRIEKVSRYPSFVKDNADAVFGAAFYTK